MSCPPTTVPPAEDVDVAALKEIYRLERNKRLRLDGQKQYSPVAERSEAIYAGDPYKAVVPRESVNEEVDVVILGGGWAGVLAGYHLRKAGISGFRIVEQAGDFGGVWYWNRYPGLSCDNDAYCYLPLLEEMQFMPSKKFVDGMEIRTYCQSVARRFELYQNALFHTLAQSLIWSEVDKRWHLSSDRGDAIRARFVIMALGPINTPKVPNIPGSEAFRGKMFHTARWDYDYTGGSQHNPILDKLSDKRVAIVGTGASAIQAIPFLGQYSQKLYVLQRTASTVDERKNTTTDRTWASALTPGWQRERQMNFHRGAIDMFMPGEIDQICDIWTEINRNLEAEFEETNGPHSLADFLSKRELMDFRVMERLRRRIDEAVRDKDTAAILKPWYRHMCKRPASSDEFYPTFNRPNVRLLDVASTQGVERLTEKGFIHRATEYEIDCLILASGFEVTSDLKRRWGIERIDGRGGGSLYEHWAAEYRTFHGVMTHQFPNIFFVGFFQGGFNATTTETFNNQTRHIAWIIQAVREAGALSAEPQAEAQDAYVDHVRKTAIDVSAFTRECTPGYFNNEGQEVSNAKGEKSTRSYAGETYGPGFYAFEKLLEGWRSSGSLDGLSLTR